MIKISNVEVVGFGSAIRGMRNPHNSWANSDSIIYKNTECIALGKNDHDLMLTLSKGGPVHAKYRRMLVVYMDILAPLYWWKEFDTYKVGTVANSCSTMHTIHKKPFILDDFSHEHLSADSRGILGRTVVELNANRERYLETKDKGCWWQIIQLLPSSYNQKRTVMLSYETLSNIYHSRYDHKLDEWIIFCEWVESLPHSDIITVISRNSK